MMDFAKLLKYECLVFDLDGTLVDSMPFHYGAWVKAVAPFGFVPDREWMYRHGGVPSHKIARILIDEHHLPFDDPHELAAIKTRNYLENIRNVEVYPVMLELLNFAREHNIHMGIGTGTLRSNVEYIVNHTILKDYIKVIVSADDVKNHKPHPDTFLKVAEAFGADPHKSAVFEDSYFGYEAAINGGFDLIKVINGIPEFQ